MKIIRYSLNPLTPPTATDSDPDVRHGDLAELPPEARLLPPCAPSKIVCVGRNYAEHAKEMGGDAAREPPFFFTKPADAIVPIVAPEVGSVPYPLATKNYQYELELVAAIGSAGVNVAPERANELIYGYAVGLDLTRRDLKIDMR